VAVAKETGFYGRRVSNSWFMGNADLGPSDGLPPFFVVFATPYMLHLKLELLNPHPKYGGTIRKKKEKEKLKKDE